MRHAACGRQSSQIEGHVHHADRVDLLFVVGHMIIMMSLCRDVPYNALMSCKCRSKIYLASFYSQASRQGRGVKQSTLYKYSVSSGLPVLYVVKTGELRSKIFFLLFASQCRENIFGRNPIAIR